MQITDIAVAIDEYRARHCDDVIQLADTVLRVVQHREADRTVLQERLPVGRILFDVDAQQREAEWLVLPMNLLEQRHLLPARPAPTRPEVDHDNPAFEIAEADGVTVGVATSDSSYKF